jgi:hypothetical protein
MQSNRRTAFLLLGAFAILGWAWPLWLLVRPAPASDVASATAERWLVPAAV